MRANGRGLWASPGWGTRFLHPRRRLSCQADILREEAANKSISNDADHWMELPKRKGLPLLTQHPPISFSRVRVDMLLPFSRFRTV